MPEVPPVRERSSKQIVHGRLIDRTTGISYAPAQLQNCRIISCPCRLTKGHRIRSARLTGDDAQSELDCPRGLDLTSVCFLLATNWVLPSRASYRLAGALASS